MNLTACRDPTECPASPAAPGDSFLVASPLGAPIKEHEIQEYTCAEGYTLAGVQHPLVRYRPGTVPDNSSFSLDDKVVEIPCKKGNDETFLEPTQWDPKETWPVCLPLVEECSELPELSGFTLKSEPLPVPVGSSITLECSNTGNEAFTVVYKKSNLINYTPSQLT